MPENGRRLIRILCSLLLISLFVCAAISFVASGPGKVDVDRTVSTSALVAHAPISISGDADFVSTAASEGWAGDGSSSDPFVIDGYEIDASGIAQGIFIESTSVHFVISNCTVSGASESGIKLFSVVNGVVIDNVCAINTWYGIAVASSSSVELVNNSCSGGGCGIILHSSSQSVVFENDCSYNGDGIILMTSENNTVGGNLCTFNVGDGITSIGDGIRLIDSDHNLLSINDCDRNVRYQIRLEYSHWNTIQANLLWKELVGTSYYLDLYFSDENILEGNTLCYLLAKGTIRLVYSYGNEVDGNVVGGVYLDHSNWNALSSNSGLSLALLYSNNNSADNNTFTGSQKSLYAVSSNNNTFSDNDLSGSKGFYSSMSNRPPGYGILLEDSDGNIMLRNNCSFSKYGGGFGAYGISLDSSSDDNSILNNTCDWNEGIGVLLSGGHNTLINNSVCRNGGVGIYLEGDFSMLANNIVSFNEGTGIYYYGLVDNCAIDSNRLQSNGDYGIYVYGGSNTITGNSIESSADFGIYVGISYYTPVNILRQNALVNDGLYVVEGGNVDADTTNTVNGRPLHQLRSQVGGSVPAGAGQVILVNCENVVVEEQNLSRADVGLILLRSGNCTIENNTCLSGDQGILLSSSYFNAISYNNLSGNRQYGMMLSNSGWNQIFENGFFDNMDYGLYVSGTSNRIWNNTFARNNGAGSTYDEYHVQARNIGTNFWNLTSIGNYWGDWTLPDVNYDGIVDIPYLIDGYPGTTDYYPRTTPKATIPTDPIPEFGPVAFLVIVISVVLVATASRRRGLRT